MKQLSHIVAQKEVLDLRWRILKQIRQFFWAHGFQEVETPLLLTHAGQEPYLSPMSVNIHNEHGVMTQAYLHTSPEYTMKKMLAAGYDRIFSLTKCFRDFESFGGLHHPEFTMLEFYEVGGDMETLMKKIVQLYTVLYTQIAESGSALYELQFRRVSMKELWQEVLSIDLEQYLEVESMKQLCVDRGYTPASNEPYEDLFYRIFLNEIEPALKDMGVVMIYNYPVQMAALAKVSKQDSRYAERLEVYIHGIEIANGFAELTDAGEQQRRFEKEQRMRQKLGKPVYNIDEAFIAAVDALPPCAGIAVGVDRLVQVLVGCQSIDDVLVLPMSKQ